MPKLTIVSIDPNVPDSPVIKREDLPEKLRDLPGLIICDPRKKYIVTYNEAEIQQLASVLFP
jgi:hypothetical protein